jgi:DNA-binding NarL/FixJ family response regulator
VYDRLEGLAASSGLRHVRAFAERVDGLLCGPEGLAHLEAALRLFAHAALPWEAARTRMSIARLLAGTLPEVAVAEARAASEVFRALGAVRDADEAANLLRSLGSRAGPTPRSAGVLTRREREVLRLLVEGLSNQQIAERLFLSKRTVEHHVGAILAKTGAGTRAEALAHAVHHGVE